MIKVLNCRYYHRRTTVMAKYRQGSVIVEAVQFDYRRWHADVMSWTHESYQPRDGSWGYIQTGAVKQHIWDGDWVVTNAAGEKHVVKDSIFKGAYEPVKDEVTFFTSPVIPIATAPVSSHYPIMLTSPENAIKFIPPLSAELVREIVAEEISKSEERIVQKVIESLTGQLKTLRSGVHPDIEIQVDGKMIAKSPSKEEMQRVHPVLQAAGLGFWVHVPGSENAV
jgi:hypothetical protein